MTFVKENLPDPATYFENRGQKIIGKGKRFRTTCAIHGGEGDTLSVLRDEGGFYCFSCGAKGGDIVSYEMQVNDVDFVTAVKSLGAWVDDGKPHAKQNALPLTAKQALNLLASESMILLIVASDFARGIPTSETDLDRVLTAVARIGMINEDFS